MAKKTKGGQVKGQTKAKGQAPSVLAKAKAKAKSPAKSKGPAKDEGNIFDRSVQFLREVKNEIKRVTWPTRKQTIQSTGVVLILVIIVSVFLGLVDMVLARLVRLVIG